MHFLCLIISDFPMVIYLTAPFSIVCFYLSYFLYVYFGMLKVKLIHVVISSPVFKKWRLFPLLPLSLKTKVRQRFIICKRSALDRLWTGSRGSMALGPMNSETTDSFID